MYQLSAIPFEARPSYWGCSLLGARQVATLRLLAASGAFGNTMNFLEVGFPLIEKSMRRRETAKSPRE